jgi:hypothetical protein
MNYEPFKESLTPNWKFFKTSSSKAFIPPLVVACSYNTPNQPTNQKTSRLTKLYKMMKPCPKLYRKKAPKKGRERDIP